MSNNKIIKNIVFSVLIATASIVNAEEQSVLVLDDLVVTAFRDARQTNNITVVNQHRIDEYYPSMLPNLFMHRSSRRVCPWRD